MEKERNYLEDVKGLREAEGDCLVDVIGIWRYNIEQLTRRGENDQLLQCAQALIPELNRIILDKKTNLGLRGEAILTLCSIITAFINNPQEELMEPTIKEALETLTKSLQLPTIVYGRKAAEKIINQLKIK